MRYADNSTLKQHSVPGLPLPAAVNRGTGVLLGHNTNSLALQFRMKTPSHREAWSTGTDFRAWENIGNKVFLAFFPNVREV